MFIEMSQYHEEFTKQQIPKQILKNKISNVFWIKQSKNVQTDWKQ
jgi:hypothetical protein